MPELVKQNIIDTFDSYKDFHAEMLAPGTEGVTAYWEARKGAMYPYSVFFGLQPIIKKWLEGVAVTKEMIDDAEVRNNEHFKFTGEKWDRTKWDYIVDTYGGRLPLRIDAVPEGTVVPIDNIMMRMTSTDDKCAWLSCGIETLLSQAWYTTVVATRAHWIANIVDDFFKDTVDDDKQWLKSFYLHDFGQRGVSCMEQAGLGGMAALVCSQGTDTKMAIPYAIAYYKANLEGLAYSVIASEHSIQTSEGEEHEFEVTKRLLKRFPKGILSIVSDSYDIERAVKMYCTGLKADILARDGKLVVRPDSPRWKGDTPAAQILWIVETLWAGFGGTVNKKGYKVLDSHVGVIYGDSLTENEIRDALQLLKDNGWSAENCVYGCGGYLLQKLNRDTQRNAFKASAQLRDGVWHDIYKKPKDATKSSKKGHIKLVKTPEGKLNTVGRDESALPDQLLTVFLNGELITEWTFDQVRERAKEKFVA